jgi:hypothetical protein
MASLTELLEAAISAKEPALISSDLPQPGGVDPLGLRQINFDLMDKVFPGINNVARHIRPFTVVTWAWYRAAKIAEKQGKTRVPVSVLKDFVDRIEVVFVWSQFVRDPDCSLPGRDVLAPFISKAEYRFGGAEWERRRKTRAYSTSLSAPINYGPALKTFGWLQPDLGGSGALVSTPVVKDALTALEEALKVYLDHPVFSKFGDVRVSGADVAEWAEAWALDQPTEAEKRVMAETMKSEPRRRDGVALVVAAKSYRGVGVTIQELRRTMCGAPTEFGPQPLEAVIKAWRTMQNRQAFRLALESLFYWVMVQLEDRPATTATLADRFLSKAGDAETVGYWLDAVRTITKGPADWVEDLQRCVAEDDNWDDLPATIRGALAACFAEVLEPAGMERPDRLPLARAAHEVSGWLNSPVNDFIVHVLGSWVFGQHVYWAVGRGLADARARGKTILRLKVTLEEDGWTLTPGAVPAAPRATADRLATMVNLMRESGSLTD